jgi:hypothetical protein
MLQAMAVIWTHAGKRSVRINREQITNMAKDIKAALVATGGETADDDSLQQ